MNNGLQSGELTYNTEVLGDLIGKDTDLDGVADWEEGLWGTDPTKRDTNDDGTPDSVEIEKIKKANGQSEQGESLFAQSEANLTETDKFSRELFATIAALNETGAMDEAAVDKISSSLVEQMKNTAPEKVYVLADLKITKSDTMVVIKKYSSTVENLGKKYPVKNTVIGILQEFSADENNVDVSALSKLNPIIGQMKSIIQDMLKIDVPQSLSATHLNFINAIQKLMENLEDIQLYDTDTILALSAISQYEKNAETMQAAATRLSNALDLKLKN